MSQWIDKAFPIMLITLDVAAGIVYATFGNWRLCIYWLSAAVLTACVTF